jgi:hypothetical protein
MTPIKLFKKIRIIVLESIWGVYIINFFRYINNTGFTTKQFNFVGLAIRGIELFSEALVS